MKYFANEKTGKWHIVGYCCHSKYPYPKVQQFCSEEALYEHYGRSITPCKLCQKRKEEKLRKGE